MFNRSTIALVAGMATAVALTSTAIIASSASATPIEVSQPAPVFTGVTSTGDEISLSDFAGKTVVLEWSNHGCPFVQKHYADPRNNMQTLQSDAASDDVVWLTVISSAPGKQGYVTGAEADELTTSRGASPHAVILDPAGEIGKLYGAKTTPHMYVITETGDLAYQGAIDSIRSANADDIDKADNYVTAALDAVAAGETPQIAETSAYGCSVKYAS